MCIRDSGSTVTFQFHETRIAYDQRKGRLANELRSGTGLPQRGENNLASPVLYFHPGIFGKLENKMVFASNRLAGLGHVLLDDLRRNRGRSTLFTNRYWTRNGRIGNNCRNR